jgi:ATP-dependent Clp protease adapter protein ClpS
MADTLTIDKISSDIIVGRPYNCILFNDDFHAMNEVASQIVKAIHCDSGTAIALMMEAHRKGRAIIYTGGLERCEHVSAVLEEIKLGTKVEPV